MATVAEVLQIYGETRITRANNVLHLELLQLLNINVRTLIVRVLNNYLSNHFGVGLGCLLGLILALGTSNDHFARGENECSCLRLTDTNDHSSESLWIILGISTLECDISKLEGYT